MKILIAITYYRPHMSGLTIYAERLAKALVKEGHNVTVLTAQFKPELPLNEIKDEVHIIRVPVLMHISKGVIMPSFGRMAGKLIKKHDIVHLHLPQFDAARVAFRGWMQSKPTVITYHCDLQMPNGIISWAANQAVLLMNNLAALFSDRIVTYTQDYADHSNFIRRYKRKLRVINPPVELPGVTTEQIAAYKKQHNPKNVYPIIGMAARFASEKGVEVLLNALESIIAKYPNAQVWFAGPYKNVMSEGNYYRRLKPLIEKYIHSKNWKYFGLLSPDEMALFYPNLDILTIPSLNSTEAFGLVQIEAMMNGVPSIASNLPGVRQPVIRHGLGEVISIGSSAELSNAVLKIMDNKNHYSRGWKDIAQQYSPASVAKAYSELFGDLVRYRR